MGVGRNVGMDRAQQLWDYAGARGAVLSEGHETKYENQTHAAAAHRVGGSRNTDRVPSDELVMTRSRRGLLGGEQPVEALLPAADGTDDLYLREVVEDDLAVFFDFQRDPDANYMAAFIARDPTDREAFTAHWHKIMADPTNAIRTIVCDGQVVGSVSSYEESGKSE